MPSQAGAGLEFLREATGHPPEGRCWGLQAFSQSSWAAVLGTGGLVSSGYLGCTGTCGGSIVASVRLSRPQATVGRSWRGLGFRRAVEGYHQAEAARSQVDHVLGPWTG